MVENTPISLAPPNEVIQEEPGISLDTGGLENVPQMPKETVNQRSYKAAYGLASTVAAKPQEALAYSFAQNKEFDERSQAALLMGHAKATAANDLVTQYISSKQGVLTPEDLNNIRGLKDLGNQLVNPQTVFETQFANTYVSELDKFAQKKDSEHFWNIAQSNAPKQVKEIEQFGARTIGQNEILNTVSQEILQDIGQQGWLGFGADWLKMAFPLFNPYYEIKMRGNVPGVNFFSGLLGPNLEKQRLELSRIPDLDEYNKRLREIVEPLRKDNPQLALAFVEAMKGQTSSDYILNNINTIGHIADVAGLVGGARALFRTRKALQEVRNAVKDHIEASTNPEQTAVNTQASVGDMASAGATNAAQNITNFHADPAKASIERLGSWLTNTANNVRMNPGTLSQARANMLAEDIEVFRDKFLSTQANMNKIDRLNLEKINEESLRQLYKDIELKHPELPFLGFGQPYRDPLVNRWLVDGFISKPGGELWSNPATALEFAQQQGMYGIAIKKITAADKQALGIDRQGLGYYIKVTKPVPENAAWAHDFIVNETRAESMSPESWINSRFGKFRTAEDTFSEEQRINRKPTIFSQAILRELASEEARAISDVRKGITRTDEFGQHIPWYRRLVDDNNALLASTPFNRKREWRQFQQMLVDLNYQQNKNTGSRGVTLESPKDVQDYYWRTFNRAPTWTETQAYFAVTRLNEMDFMLRQIALVRNQSRLGAEMHTIKLGDAKTEPFAGIRVASLPRSNDTVAILGDTPGQEQIHRLNALGKKLKKGETTESWSTWNKRIKSGEYRLIRIYDPELAPLNGFGKIKDEYVRYVITKNAETGPLTFDQIKRTGGIHHVYEYDNYAKQAIIKKEIVDGRAYYRYMGDRNLFGVENRAMGQRAIDGINEWMRLMKENKVEEAKALANSGKTPWDHNELYDRVRPKVVDGKHVPARLDLDEPIQMVPNRRTISQTGKQAMKTKYNQRGGHDAAFIDNTTTGSDARAFQIEFTGERDADNFYGLKDYGTKGNPVFKLEQAEMKDPLTTLSRALGNIIHSNLMDDYKISAIQAWLKEAQPLLKEGPEQTRSAPFYYFKTITRDSFELGNDIQQKRIDTLLANKFKIDQMIGTPHKLDTFLHGVAQDIADGVYNRFGPKVAQLTPAWLMPTLKDPFQYFRSFTFNAYLGLFAVPQLMVQNMTWATIYAISPRAATRSSVATILHQMSRMNNNEKILNALDKVASKMGWKPGEWLEAMREGDRTGFFSVGGEWAGLNTAMAPNVVRNGKDTFLRAGQIFFREGERNVRFGAWYTAFKEWREANPTKQITQADRNKILDRADLLYGNMSTASNAFLDKGVWSTATQFYAYNMRLAELFMSGTGRTGLTLAERNMVRARLVGIYSLLFGVPGALGLSGFPLADYMKKAALEGNVGSFQFGPFQSRGFDFKPYVAGEHKGLTALMEGLPSMLGQMMTGNLYNIQQRYGLGGVTQPRDLLYSDASFWKVWLGASYTMLTNTLANSDGLIMLISSIMHGDPKIYTPKIQDAIDFLKEIQSVNRGWMMWTALNTSKWINKNSDVVGRDVSGLDAFWRFVSGLNTTEQAEIHTKGLVLKDRQELAKYGMERAEQEFNRSVLAAAKGDWNNSTDFMARVVQKLDWSGWPKDKQGDFWAIAYRRNKDLIGRINWEFYRNKMNGVSSVRREELNNALTTIERLRNQR